MKTTIAGTLFFALTASSLVMLSFKIRTSSADGEAISDQALTSSLAFKWVREAEPSHAPEEVDTMESIERSRTIKDVDEEHKRRLESMLEKSDYELVRIFSYVMLLGSKDDREDVQGAENIAQRAQEYRQQLRQELDGMKVTRRQGSSRPRRLLSRTIGLTRTIQVKSQGQQKQGKSATLDTNSARAINISVGSFHCTE